MILAQLAHFDFGDQRLNARCSHCAKQIIEAGAQNSFPRIFKDPYQLKAFYRLMNNEKIDHADFFAGYQKGVIAQLREQHTSAESQVLYLFNDTTFGKYHHRRHLQLGYLERPHENGLLIHTSVLTDDQMLPLSPAVQKLHIRQVADFGKKHNRTQTSFAEKESYKWTYSIEWAEQLSEQTGAQVVQVNDREADIAELYNFAFARDQFFIIRSGQNRRVIGSDDLLWDWVRKQPLAAQSVRELLDRKGQAHALSCQLRWGTVLLRDVDQAMQIIHLQANDPKVDLETTEWFLLTNLPLDRVEQLEHVIDVYVHRWRTCEDFHKCLKTGCKIHERQFNSVKALSNAIALLSLVAIRLLRMRYIAQLEGHRSVNDIFTPQEVELAKLLAPQYLKPGDLKHGQPGSVMWGMLLIARLGGHQGFQHKGMPGWQTLYHGWKYFQNLLEGINLSKNIFKPPDP